MLAPQKNLSYPGGLYEPSSPAELENSLTDKISFPGEDPTPHEHQPVPGHPALGPQRAQAGGVQLQLPLPAVDHELQVQVAGLLTPSDGGPCFLLKHRSKEVGDSN